MFPHLTQGLPTWAMESDDPYIARLRQASYLEGFGYAREFFDEMLAGNACTEALALAGERRERRRGCDDGLELRCLEAYAERAAQTHTPLPSQAELAALAGPWQPGPEDVVLALELKGEEEFTAELMTQDAQRDGDYGQEAARVDPTLDAIDRLLAWAGRRDCQGRVPLATVLATVKARWQRLSPAQRRLVNRLIGQSRTWEEARPVTFRHPRRGRVTVDVPVVRRSINSLYERANHAETQALIDEALDRYEDQLAARDDDAHPADSEPAVQVALDNQARFLDWVAKGAQSAQPAQPTPAKPKPWLARPTYIHVLSHALESGARTPKEAHNRAYAADTLRLPDRILGVSPEGFQVLLNRQGQTGAVPFADARIAWPYLPPAARARMKELHGRGQ